MLHAVIMAGGAGTRFWPASRADFPKQLLNLTGERSMIQATVDRLGDLVTPDRLLVLTNQRLVEGIQQQLPELPEDSIIGEPCKRDTAPCIGLAAGLVNHADEDAIMVVMPADHVIPSAEVFQSAIRHAVELVEENPRRLVTFGIRPTYPADIFGYIERDESLPVAEDRPASFSVTRFREKPSTEVAEEYLDSGNFYWNAGIFVWKASTILAALNQFEPDMASHIESIVQAQGTDNYDDVLAREFAAIQGKSIDFAVMEHYPEVVVVEAPFEWDDVGSWQSLQRLNPQDADGNTVVGKHLGVRTSGSIVRSSDEHLIATLGVDDLIIVHTNDATLVAHKSEEGKIRDIVKRLEEGGDQEFL